MKINKYDLSLSLDKTSNIWLVVLIPIFLFFIYIYSIHGVISLLFSNYIHEIAHYKFLRRYNINIDKIKITLFGCYVDFDDNNLSPRQDIIMSLSGPIFGSISTLLIYPYMSYFTSSSLAKIIVVLIIIQNILNILPIKGSDGYHILKSFNNLR